MLRCLKLVAAIAIPLVVSHVRVVVPARSFTRPQKEARLARLENRPDLGVNMSRVARLRLSSERRVYRIGELVKLELALVNVSRHRTYFPQLGRVEIFSSDKKGNRKQATAIALMTEVMPTPETYSMIEPGELHSASRQVLPTCNRQAFQQIRAELTTVERNLLLCVDIGRPGTYSITSELTNWFVVLSPDEQDLATAIGRLRSNALTIMITR